MKKILLACVIAFSIAAQSVSMEKVTASKRDLAALKEAAEKGDARAQLEYGKAINEAGGKDASIWVQKAADQGLGEAWFWLGYNCAEKEKIIFYYKKAAEKGVKEAFSPLLREVLFGAGPSADVLEAKRFADLARKLNIDLGLDTLRTIDICYEAGRPNIPTADLPISEEIKSFKDSKTDCLSLHPDSGTHQGWSNYRKCLLSRNEEGNNNYIAEIYANGWGVKRNSNLALALSCHGSSVPFELMLIVNKLYPTRNQEKLQDEFHFCDYVTSGYNSGLCASRNEDIASNRRKLETAKITNLWTTQQKHEFQKLQKSAEEFFYARANLELYTGGTGQAQRSISEETKLRDEFLKAIKAFEEGKFPTDPNFVKADKDLNALYSKIMRIEADMKDTIKHTERKWIKYRDAWVKFAGIKYPNTNADLLKTWLTRERIKHLKAILDPD